MSDFNVYVNLWGGFACEQARRTRRPGAHRRAVSCELLIRLTSGSPRHTPSCDTSRVRNAAPQRRTEPGT